MPQIAQQDYLEIPIENIQALTDAEKAVVEEKILQGVIFDCIFIYDGYRSRPVSYDYEGRELYLYDVELNTVSF